MKNEREVDVLPSRLCPFCMQMTEADTCHRCGKDVNYIGSPVHLPAGYVIDGKHPYVLGAALGQGGFGITYIALDMVTNMRVAIKEYFPTFCATRTEGMVSAYPNQEETFQKGRRRFLDEARTLKSLSDLDSIVDVLDFFEFNNSAYLVMEFLDGSSLKNYAAQKGKFSAQEFLKQISPLMEDIHRMHQRGIIHRDIAPDNIILLPNGRLKLIDFGAARSFVGESSMTVVVKKGFAPVEQYVSKGSSACTDVYALAATIYYCITGKVPMESAERQYDGTPLPLPSALGAEITQQQEKALLRALEVQQKKRTQSVQELLEGIRPKTPVKSKSLVPARKKTAETKTVAEKQEKEAAAAAAKKKREAEAAATKQKREAEAAAAKQKREAEAAAAKQKREAEAAAAKQKREAEAAAAKQKREEEAAAAKQKKEAAAAAKEQRKAAAALKRRKTVKILKIVIPAVCAAAVLATVPLYIIPTAKYNKTVSLMEAGQFEAAIVAFEAMDGYRDSAQQIELCWEGIQERTYQDAVSLMQQGKYPEAIAIFQELGGYKDSNTQISACQNAMDEEAYQAAVKLMESGEFEAAKKQFEELGDYKDSKEQIQKCEMELLLIRKKNAVAMMEAGHFESALAVLKAVEADGLDCDAEIKECELGYLELNKAPYITRGKPKDQEKKVQCTDKGNVKVHSMTRVDLDNGCVRYTVDCTVPAACEFVSFFDPPDGDIFMYCDWNKQPQGRQTFVVDVLKKDIKKAGEMSMRFGQSGGFIWARNAY